MSKNITKVGGMDRAKEIVKFYWEYFRGYKFYDCKRKMFTKVKDESRPDDYVYMIRLTGEVNAMVKK
jgi:hypothetical protein